MAGDKLAKQQIAVSDRLFNNRATTENHLQDIRDYIHPDSQSFTSTNTPGEKSRSKILENSTEVVSDLLAETAHGELTNPADKWFELETGDERLDSQREVKIWLEDTERRLYEVFDDPRTRWAADIGIWYKELVDFGTAVLAIFHEFGEGVRFKHYPLAGIALAQNILGVVDTVHFKFELSAAAAFKKWGEAAGPATAKLAQDDSKAEELVDFIRIVDPLEAPDSAGRKFRSLFINKKEQITVEEKAFFEFPFMVARWKRRGNEVFGRGPGHMALPDVKMLQRQARAKIRGEEKLVDPPLAVPDDGIIGPLTLNGGEVNVFRADLLRGSQSPIQTVESGARPDVGREGMADTKANIANAYFAHLLRVPRDPRMLQDQILDIAEERARVMGPVFGRVQSEGPGTAVDRVLQILLRTRSTLPPPRALENREVKVKFKNPFAQARAVTDARAINRTVNMIIPWSERDPSVLDNVDFDKSSRLAAAGLSAPLTMFRDPRDVVAIRQRRAEAEARAAEAAIAKDEGAAAQSTAQAVQSLRPTG